MVYRQLWQRYGTGGSVRAGVIGTGHYATALVTQAPVIPLLDVCVLCDRQIEAAQNAYRLAGQSAEDVVVCDNRAAALAHSSATDA
jgi:predicted homoserine dehydrogenase-like protein